MIGLSAVLTIVSGFSAFISIKEHKVYKATGQKPGDMELEVVGSADSNKVFNIVGNGVSIHQGGDYASSSPQRQSSSHNGFGTPSQSHRQHYSHDQQEHYQQQQQQQQQSYTARR